MGVLNVTLLITEAEYGDEQKYVVRTEAEVAAGNRPTEITYASLSAGEKTEHDDVIAFCTAYIAPDTAERITMQIHQSEHESQERLIICYEDSGEQIVIKNYADLTAGEKTKYDAFKTQATGKAPA